MDLLTVTPNARIKEFYAMPQRSDKQPAPSACQKDLAQSHATPQAGRHTRNLCSILAAAILP
jgi:hypothetical protein